MSRLLLTIRDRWRGEVDGAGLSVVRMLVALGVLVEMLHVWFTNGVAELLVDPSFHFKYALFPWVGPPQGMMPAVFVWSLAIVAVLVLIGWRTRVTAWLMAAGYIYWFLIDAANYSDHGYLVCLMCVLVAWLPTNRWATVGTYSGREKRTTVPAWTVELVRLQLTLIYFFFGLSLLNADWLAGAPLIAWSEVEADNPAAALLAGRPGLALTIAWIMPALYFGAVPLLNWQRTRVVAWSVLALFSLWDALAFHLTVSPVLLTGLSLIYFDPANWRRQGQGITAAIGRLTFLRPLWGVLCRLGLMVDACVSWFDDTPLVGEARSRSGQGLVEPPKEAVSTFPGWAQGVVALWLVLQVFLPIRYLTMESQPDWTDLNTTFAWRGQHRDKQCELKLSVVQPSQELSWPMAPADEFPVPMAIFYSSEQLEKMRLSEGMLKDLVTGAEETRGERLKALGIPDAEADRIFSGFHGIVPLRLSAHQYEQLVQRPELIRQYAHRTGEVLNSLLGEEVRVLADLKVRLNHRPLVPQLSMVEEQDLRDVKQPKELMKYLLPLRIALPAPQERIEVAKAWAERRRAELEQEYDIVLKTGVRPSEPVKAPAISDEDERWFQERYAKRK